MQDQWGQRRPVSRERVTQVGYTSERGFEWGTTPGAGANIESLAVGLNIDKALFTIATTGNKSAIANLVKQLSKLVKVCSLPWSSRWSRLEAR